MTLETASIGSDYGGWVVAVAPLVKANPVVLSFGLGDDISFDEEMIRRYSAFVYGFDPTPFSMNWLGSRKLPDRMRVMAIGIAKVDGTQTFVLPDNEDRGNYSAKSSGGVSVSCDVLRYSSIVATLGLQHVDVLKLDVEGSEYDVIPDILASSALPVQLLIEFHHRIHRIGVAETLKAVEAIRRADYLLFAVSPGGKELSFIRSNCLA
ncbi:MAG: FkbM family methyltransferase [Hyphomicrobiales bacterium]|nr:FkbM family methyltransferase [Hyphomicrobiales bacterium]